MNKKSIQQIYRLFTLICACLFLPATGSYAQTARVNIKMNDVAMVNVMNEIEKQTKYLFIYDDSVDINRKVSVDATDKTLNEVLTQMLRGTDIASEIENSNIILSKKPAGPASAVVSGKVLGSDGQPVIGAAVLVKGTVIGTSTDINGAFTMNVPSPATAVLVVSYLGHDQQEVTVGNKTVFEITMTEASHVMDDVVVTALGIKRSEKALSYNVQKIDSDAVTQVKDANFINSLSGKVAGVNISSSSSGVGGSSKVVMRGAKSVQQSSNALYVIDGIPMFNAREDGGTEFESKGSSEGIADLNPEDIESMTVLTGAAAAALYGSDAANGAILITTKKGHQGRTQVTVTSGTELLSPFQLPEFQNKYGTGDLNSSVGSSNRSWGQLLNNINKMGYDPAKDYFKTGVIATETVSVSRGTETNQTYFSAGAVNSKGIVPNNSYDRYNFTFRNTASLLDDKMVLDLSASYIIQQDLNMTNQGTYMNPLTSAYLFPRGNDWNDIVMFERWDPDRKIYTQYWPIDAGDMVMQNPYWVNYRNLRRNSKDRYMMSAGLQYQILDWLSASGRVRVDNNVGEYTEKLYATTNNQMTEESKNGLFLLTNTREKFTYGDALLNIDKTFDNQVSVHANIGASIADTRVKGTKIRGPIRDSDNGDSQTGIPNVFNVAQLSDIKTTRDHLDWREQSQSVFASVELGYKSTYFLTATARNDWPSQLAGPNSSTKSFFYPSVGGSVVVSELFDMPADLSFLKVRGSFASVGMAYSRYLGLSTYGWKHSSKGWDTNTYYPIHNLKPERTRSWEVGLTAYFLKNFSLDVSFYNAKTINQTFDPKTPPASGYSTMYIQDGDVLNRGVEVALGYKNKWGDFAWSSNFTFDTNHNEILSIGENSVNPVTGEPLQIDHLEMKALGQTKFLLKKGGSLGDLYSSAKLLHDSNGNVFIDENGSPVPVTGLKDVNEWTKLGSVFPKANMGWNNNFSYKNLSFGFLISARIGGIVFSRTQAAMDYYGVSKATADARDKGGIVINGGDLIDANTWYSAIAAQDGIPQYYTYSATNVRLREASIGYTIPRKKLGDVADITLSLVGRNLFMFHNKAPFDPESVASTGNYYQGIDYFMMPSTRNIGFNVRIKF